MGQRDHMEDAYQCIQDLKLSADIKMSYFGVFDGHGGDCCALFLKEHFAQGIDVIISQAAFKGAQDIL